ncbi:MAG: hypothetical protein DHS20C01_32060 [marine bacterium B5-7]|nr:MAG: hypothetical protein DHS20C01_32060 [marine bacterium B5-7]
MSEELKLSNGRRKLLKSLVAGGSVAATTATLFPEKWTKPVVDSVVLPSHAQTTTDERL